MCNLDKMMGNGSLYFEVRLLPFACVPGFVLSLFGVAVAVQQSQPVLEDLTLGA